MVRSADLDILAARVALGIAARDEEALLAAAASEAAQTGARVTPTPSADQAAWTLLELHVGAIAHGRVEPQDGMRLVIGEVFRPAGLAGKTRYRLGDSHDIDALVALQDVYDDMRAYERRTGTPDRRQAQVDAQVTLAAQEWVRRNSAERE